MTSLFTSRRVDLRHPSDFSRKKKHHIYSFNVIIPSPPYDGACQSPSTVTETPAQNKVTRRRPRFWDIALVKEVTAVDAHIPPHRELQKRYEEALQIFTDAIPAGALDGICAPSLKTLSDRFKNILVGHRAARRSNEAVYEIIAIQGERGSVLCNVVSGIDKLEEKPRTEIDERTELNRRLVAAGEEICAREIEREVGSRDTDREERQSILGFRQENRKRSIAVDSDEEEWEFINVHITHRRELEERHIRTEQENLDSRMKLSRDHEAKRLRIEEKRMELKADKAVLEREERCQSIAER